MTVLLTTGLYHVVSNDGPLPFWVEVRTYNRRPLVGSERRVRGFDNEEAAVRYMRRATRDALKADKTLKRYVTSYDGAPLPEPSSTQPRHRGRPLGSKNKKQAKPGPKPTPKAKGAKKLVPFSSVRFTLDRSLANPIAQVWRCTTNEAKARGNAAGRGSSRKGLDHPHLAGSYAVTRLVDGTLYLAVDDDGVPLIYPDWTTAERDALFYYEQHTGEKQPLYQTMHYVTGPIEVHLLGNGDKHAYGLLDRRASVWIASSAEHPARFDRLDRAIQGADDYMKRNPEPFSVRLNKLFAEAEAEMNNPETIAREARLEEARVRREEELARQFDREQAAHIDRARRSKEEAMRRGRRPATPEEIAAKKASEEVTTKPTPEQRASAERSNSYRPRKLKDQRRPPPEGQS